MAVEAHQLIYPNLWIGKFIELAQDLNIDVSFLVEEGRTRFRDITIMAMFISHSVPPNKLQLLNTTTRVSEILHASRKRLMQFSFLNSSYPSRTGWPRKAPLDSHMMELRKVLLHQCLLDPNGSIVLQIGDPLGPWQHQEGVWMRLDCEKTVACLSNTRWEIRQTSCKQKSPYLGRYRKVELCEVFNRSHYARVT